MADEATELLRKPTQKSLHYQRDKWSVYITLVMLSFGYFGKYFCTTAMYVVEQLFTSDTGVTKEQMAMFYSAGYVASMLGKFAAGMLSDQIGGKFVVALAATGYITCLSLFSLVPSEQSWSTGTFGMLWFCNGFFALGLAWVAVVSVATNWIPTSMTATLMGVVSLAPQVGDALARATLGSLLQQDMGWRSIMQVAALTALCLNIPVLLCVSNHPPHADADDDKDVIRMKHERVPFMQRVRPILTSELLWLICVVSGSLYGTRSLFLLYATDIMLIAYCRDKGEGCMNDPAAVGTVGTCSMVYTLLGCVSVLVVGVAKDKLPKKLRALILIAFIAPLLAVMAVFSVYAGSLSFGMTVFLVGVVGLSLFGPYKVLGGAFSVDIGGKDLKATACSLMGVFDNFFAMCMIMLKGHMQGWQTMFQVCTGLSVCALFCACMVLYRDVSGGGRRRSVAIVTPPEPTDIPDIESMGDVPSSSSSSVSSSGAEPSQKAQMRRKSFIHYAGQH